MTSRRVWLAGAGATAAAAGLGIGWWRSRPDSAPVVADVWPLRFATPAGEELAMSAFRGQPLLLNFWATWCPPCVGELPLLSNFQREHAAAGWQVVGLAVDNLRPVTTFLAQRPVNFPVALAGMAGLDLSRRLGNAQGALPFSVVFDRRGEVAGRRLGIVQPDVLAGWVQTIR